MSNLYRVTYKPCVLVLTLFLIIPLSACKPPQQVKDVTIRIAFPNQFSGDTAANQALAERYKAIAAAFHEQNPHITIELTTPTWGQLDALTAKDFDVLLFGSQSYSDLTERGLLRTLSPWISSEDKAWSGDYLPNIFKPFERKGELWAIPWALDPQILYYNRDLFSQNGVEAPKQDWTWNDFQEKGLAVTDSKNGVFGAVILNKYALVPAIIYQHGGQIFGDWGQPQPAQATFDDPRNVEALSWLASLIYKDNVIPTHAQVVREFGVEWNALYSGINLGKIGMWTAGYIERGGVVYGSSEMAWKVPWGAAPLPRDAQAVTMVNAYLLGISSQAADADACWQWLAYFTQQLPPDVLLPARTSLREGLQPDDPSNQEALSAASAAMEGVLLIIIDPRAKAMPAQDAFWQAVDAVLQKNESAEVQLQQAQQKATQ
jgi:ABC-type glycerol-3-phosphate transport system substrate-binding protein